MVLLVSCSTAAKLVLCTIIPWLPQDHSKGEWADPFTTVKLTVVALYLSEVC